MVWLNFSRHALEKGGPRGGKNVRVCMPTLPCHHTKMKKLAHFLGQAWLPLLLVGCLGRQGWHHHPCAHVGPCGSSRGSAFSVPSAACPARALGTSRLASMLRCEKKNQQKTKGLGACPFGLEMAVQPGGGGSMAHTPSKGPFGPLSPLVSEKTILNHIQKKIQVQCRISGRSR